MHTLQSILLITNNPEADIKEQFNIDVSSPDIDILIITPETTIGIDSIRQLQMFASRRPLKGATKHVVILQAQLLTPEAQSALLKILEEPPPYLISILTASHAHSFLETLLSRCVIVRSRPEKSAESADEVGPNLLTPLLALSPAARLAAIPSDTKVRATAVAYCQSLIREAQNFLHHSPTNAATNNLEILADCLTHLTANANPTLCLTDAILRLQPHTSLATMAKLPEKNH